jgi:hypothetical protein
MNSTEEDTFNKLRRVSYEQACAIYCIAAMHLPSDALAFELRQATEEDLKVAGWTLDELNAESVRLEAATLNTKRICQ